MIALDRQPDILHRLQEVHRLCPDMRLGRLWQRLECWARIPAGVGSGISTTRSSPRLSSGSPETSDDAPTPLMLPPKASHIPDRSRGGQARQGCGYGTVQESGTQNSHEHGNDSRAFTGEPASARHNPPDDVVPAAGGDRGSFASNPIQRMTLRLELTHLTWDPNGRRRGKRGRNGFACIRHDPPRTPCGASHWVWDAHARGLGRRRVPTRRGSACALVGDCYRGRGGYRSASR